MRLSIAEVKYEWSYTSTIPYAFMAWFLLAGSYSWAQLRGGEARNDPLLIFAKKKNIYSKFKYQNLKVFLKENQCYILNIEMRSVKIILKGLNASF
jgi:hypothetical protein